MAQRADVARERRVGLLAGAAGLSVFVLTVAAISVSASGATSGPRTQGGDDRELLINIGLHGDEQLIGASMRALSVALLAVMALYLFRVIRARDPAHSRFVPLVGLVAFTILAATTMVSFGEVRDVAREFVASGPRTAERAETMLEAARDDGLLRVLNLLSLLGAVVFGIWVSLASYEGMRVGIFTRFLGVFGIGTGVASAIGITAVAASLFMGWIVSVSLLALGWWPGGRPPAWDEGRAVSLSEVDARRASARGGT